MEKRKLMAQAKKQTEAPAKDKAEAPAPADEATEAPAQVEDKTEAQAPAEQQRGLPTTESAPEQPIADIDAERAKEFEDRDDLRVAAVGSDDSEVVKADEKIGKVYKTASEDDDPYVELEKDVVEEFYYPDTKRPSHRLLFTKGQVVRKSAIDALNARVENARAVAGPEIDSTTRAYQAGQGDSNADAAPADEGDEK